MGGEASSLSSRRPPSAIKIRIDGETQDAERSLEAVADSLEQIDTGLEKVDRSGTDAAQALDKVESAGSSMDKVGKEIKDVGESAQDAGRRIDRDLTEALKDADRAAESMGDSAGKASKRLGDDVSDGARRSSEAVSEFKDEARQNFGEVTSSFSGDMDSIVDLAQGTFGGLAGTLTGPVGLALGGLAASAGLFYNAWKTSTEKTQQAVEDMYADMKASGANALSESFIQGEIDKIVTDAEGKVISFAEAQQYAATTGADLATVLRAMAGDAEAWASVQESVQAKQDAVTDSFGRTDEIMKQTGESYETVRQRLLDEQTALDEVNARLNEGTKNRERATAAAEASRSTQKASAATAREAAEAEASYKDAVEASADAIKTNGKNLAANRQAILDAASAAADYTDALKENAADAKTVDDAQRAMYSQLVDLAVQSGVAEKDARGLINTFLDFPDDIETGVTLDSAEAERRLRAIQNGNYTATVKVTTDASGVVRQIENALTGKTVRINVMPRVGRPVVNP